jgi:sec-independent protein translocase protein TatA
VIRDRARLRNIHQRRIFADILRRNPAAEGKLPAMPFNVGPGELIIVLVIALIVLGPKRLPEVGRSIGNGMREFKDSISGDSRRDDDDDEMAPLHRPAAD